MFVVVQDSRYKRELICTMGLNTDTIHVRHYTLILSLTLCVLHPYYVHIHEHIHTLMLMLSRCLCVIYICMERLLFAYKHSTST